MYKITTRQSRLKSLVFQLSVLLSAMAILLLFVFCWKQIPEMWHIWRLTSNGASTRRNAIAALTEVGTSKAIPHLMVAGRQGDAERAAGMAILAIASREPTGAVTRLNELLKHPDAHIRAASGTVLGNLGAGDSSTSLSIAQALTLEHNDLVKLILIRALVRLGHNDDSVQTMLHRLSESSDLTTKQNATLLLREVENVLVPEIIRMKNSSGENEKTYSEK